MSLKFELDELELDWLAFDDLTAVAFGLLNEGCSPWLVSLELELDELELDLLNFDDLTVVAFGWLDDFLLAILEDIYKI